VDVRGGGPGTRETDVISPLAGTDRVTAVMLAGGSAYGLAAADGAMRWLEERGVGYPTPAGVVPIVPAAIVYDLAEGDPGARPDAAAGYAACEAAAEGVPERGQVGAGSGTAASKIMGRERAVACGVGYSAERTGGGAAVAALAVANPFGDVIGADGEPVATCLDDEPPDPFKTQAGNTTLVCLMTDLPLQKAECARVARAGAAGLARAVEPVFTDVDGDVVFCLAAGDGEAADRFSVIQAQALAAGVAADAVRDAVISSR
jgi:L-aminopeptidase/D-esterase-like protein